MSTLTNSPAPERRIEFEYDWQGRRIRKTVYQGDSNPTPTWTEQSDTLFLYDGWNLSAELNANASNTPIRTYVWGNDPSGSMQGAGLSRHSETTVGGVGGLLKVVHWTSPTTLQIHNSDVLVMYGDRVLDVRDSQRTDLEVFLQRGGGLVVLHNTVEQPKAALFAPRLGMTWKPDKCRWKGGVARILDLDPEHPVTRGLQPFLLAEELGQGIELAPGAHVLAKGAFRGEPATPQIWTVETNGQRTVVILPGHNYATFEQPEFRVLFCRAIAWAAKFDPDTLLLPEERVRYGSSTPPAPPAPNPPAAAERKKPQAKGGAE